MTKIVIKRKKIAIRGKNEESEKFTTREQVSKFHVRLTTHLIVILICLDIYGSYFFIV